MGHHDTVNIRLSAIVFSLDGYWHGQCLEHDIAARAESQDALAYALERAIVANLKVAEENGLAGLSLVPPAPEAFRRLFERGRKLPEHRFTVVEIVRRPVTELSMSETLAPA